MTEATSPDQRLHTVAVAGGTGFVGSAIVTELARRGHHVVVLSHRRGLPPALTSLEREGAVESRTVDVTKSLDAATLDDIDCLVIALAFKNYPVEAPRRGRTFERVDAYGALNLVAVARMSNVKRIVYMSGAGAAPDATKPWFQAKWHAEQGIRAAGIPYTIFRPSWIYGPGDSSLNRFIGFTRWLPFVPQIGNGRQRLAPLFIDDMAALVADAIETNRAANRVLEVGGPETIEMDEVVRKALRALGRRRFILHAPVTLMKMATAPLVLLPAPPMRPSAIDFVVQSAPVDTTVLREILPRPLHRLDEALPTYLSPR
jgi:NADH dehydrogenase